MRTLIYDLSPLLYGCLISASNEVKRNGQKVNQETQKLDYDYEDIVIFKIFEELSQIKHKFSADEVIIATDTPGPKGYFRRDIFSGYKSSRAKKRKDSDIDWTAAFVTFNKIIDVLEYSSFKVLQIERAEADDINFILSKYLSDKDINVVLYTVDGDWVHSLRNKNVTMYRSRKTQRKDDLLIDITQDELDLKEEEHILCGDTGDYVLHIKSYSQFSEDFIDKYPKYKDKELNVWDKRFEIACAFEDKTGLKAYKHPRFGIKSFKKTGVTTKDLLKQNKIFEKNYENNKNLVLPSGIPINIQTEIINQYHSSSDIKNIAKIQNFFLTEKLFELTSYIALL